MDKRAAAKLFSEMKAQCIEPEHADSCSDALEGIPHRAVDLLIVDIEFLDLDGTVALARTRAEGGCPPILGLMDMTDEHARAKASAIGCANTMQRGSSRADLVERTRLLLAAGSSAQQSKRQNIAMTGKEFELRQLFMLNRNVALCAGLSEAESKIVDVFVCKIRRKFTETGLLGAIQTVWGRGYVLRDARYDDSDEAPEPYTPEPVRAFRRELPRCDHADRRQPQDPPTSPSGSTARRGRLP